MLVSKNPLCVDLVSELDSARSISESSRKKPTLKPAFRIAVFMIRAFTATATTAVVTVTRLKTMGLGYQGSRIGPLFVDSESLEIAEEKKEVKKRFRQSWQEKVSKGKGNESILYTLQMETKRKELSMLPMIGNLEG